MMGNDRLFWRAVLAFLALPGTVAFAVPLLVIAPSVPRSFSAWGIVPLAIGTLLLLWCLRDFYVAGKGTLAPWTPPEELVVVGLYRFSRNPMYLSVMLILCGWALGFRSPPLAWYAVLVAIAFHLRVVLFEEPWLDRRHGDRWAQYKSHVPRWFR